ncbi:uncharacterized protein LOC135137861 [Zophobas morio]
MEVNSSESDSKQEKERLKPLKEETKQIEDTMNTRKARKKQNSEIHSLNNENSSVLKKFTKHPSDAPDLHIPRNVSTVFVKTDNIHHIYKKNQAAIIINCDATLLEKISLFKKIHSVEICDYLEERYNKDRHFIIVSTKRKCTHDEFALVCQKSNKSNVYLFQNVDDKLSALLLQQGNELSSDLTDQTTIPQEDISNYFDSPVHAICGPTGIGKSTLMKNLANTGGSYVDLSQCNELFSENPGFETMLNFFVKNENSPSILYLDGLNEVDSSYVNCVLNFAKEASSRGIRVWISSRDNLREKLSRTLNVVPIEIRELNKEQQEEYMEGKLRHKYTKEQIEKIVTVILADDNFNNQALLGNPLLLQVISDRLLSNDGLYTNIEEQNILVPIELCHLFLEAKISHVLDSIDTEVISTHLKLYEVPALKACLDVKHFEKIGLNLEKFENFMDQIQRGDKYGIIKGITRNGDPVFEHQICAEYLTCVWLEHHKNRTLLHQVMFTEKYKNLRAILDLLLAKDNPLHLSIINHDLDQFEKHKDKLNTTDRGGRTPMHLICTHGQKIADMRSREHPWYIAMVKIMLHNGTSMETKDDLFNYTYLDYCLEAQCLYTMEAILENKLVNFDQIKETIFRYSKIDTLVYYAAQMGYRYLFCALILEKPQLLFQKIRGQTLLVTAVNGTWNDRIVPPRKGNISIVNMLLRCCSVGHNSSILDMAFENRKYDMLQVLVKNGLQCSGTTIWHRLSIDKTKPSDAELELLENIEAAEDINKKCNGGLTALQVASHFGASGVAKILLKKEADLYVTDEENNTLLHYASLSLEDNEDVIKLLIEKGINVDAQELNGTTALHLACQTGNYKNTKMLLDSEASIYIVDEKGNNPLHYASKSTKSNPDIIKLLLEKGMDVDAQNVNGATALHIACGHSNYDVAKVLLDFGASIDTVDKHDKNALHYAAQFCPENRDVLKLLIQKGIDLNAQDQNGTTALQIACREGVYDNAETLLDSGALIAVTDHHQNNSLHYASAPKKDNRSVIQLLLRKGLNINSQNKNGMTALQIACLEGGHQNAELLLDSGASTNLTDKSNHNIFHYASASRKVNPDIITLLFRNNMNDPRIALLIACQGGVYENVKTLLDLGVSIHTKDNDNRNPLHYASSSKQVNRNIIKLLIDKGIDVNARSTNGVTALQIACLEGVHENAKLLLDCGASVNLTDHDDRNSLHYASASPRVNQTIINVLTKEIDLNAQDKVKTTALHLACQEGVYDNVEMLLDCGASINVVDKDNHNVLHYAAASKHINRSIIELLLDKGIDVNAQAKNGMTALHIACLEGVYDNVEVLLDSGASININDNDNHNVLHYAVKQVNPDVIKLLLEKGIDINAQDNNGRTALQIACYEGVHANATFLLDSSASINTRDKNKENAMHYAAASRRVNRNIITLLLEKGIYINAQTIYGMTALQIACREGVYENAETLLRFGASINLVDERNKNALHYASQSLQDNQNIIKLLLERGMELDVTVLQNACLEGVYQNVKTLIDCGIPTYLIDNANKTALHYASASKRVNRDTIKLLLDKGIDIDARNKSEMTALQIACREGVYENTETLLRLGASIDIVDEHHNNALHYASQSLEGNQRIINLLTDEGMDLDAQNQNGTTALQFACLGGVYENVETLLDLGASFDIIDHDKKNLLHYASASKKANRDVIELLCEKGINVNAQSQNGMTPLQTACLEGVQENAKLLLDCGASVNLTDHDDKNSLHYASASPRVNQVIIQVLAKEIDLNAQDKVKTTALHFACQAGVYDNVEMLLDCGASIDIADKNNHNVLHYAAASKHVNRSIIELLLDKGIDVNAQAKNGMTALHIACIEGVYDNVEVLLDSGASININDNYNHNVLHYAVKQVNPDVIKLLLEKGIDINAQDNNGRTALHIACYEGVYANATLLLDSGASIKTRDKNNENAMHYAAASRRVNQNIITLLLEKGICINAQTIHGMTALQVACREGVHENAETLLRFGASINLVDERNKNALHYASQSLQDNQNIIKLLLERGIELNATVLQNACLEGVYQNVKTLIDCGIPTNIIDNDNKNALHYASASKRVNRDTIKLLLDKGIGVDTQSKNGMTALQIACREGVYENAETLLRFGASIDILDEHHNNALHYASQSLEGNQRIINLLTDEGMDLYAQNQNGTTALQLACLGGVYENVETLLDLGASFDLTDHDKKNLLHYASASKKPNRDVIELLCDKGINVNARTQNGMTPLQIACLEGVYENAETLLRFASIDTVDEHGKNALHYASQSVKGNRNIIKLLTEKGMDLDVKTKSGMTALHLACLKGVYENAKTLLDSGASVNTTGTNNKNALHYASASKKVNQDIMLLLIAEGINLNARTKNGMTPLYIACLEGVYENVETLLGFGASVNTDDEHKKNALHYASTSRGINRNTIKLLIERGIDVNAQNENGTTALHLTCLEGVYENVETLLNCAASINTTDKNNKNALHYASASRTVNPKIIKLLLNKGISVDCQHKNGTTPLQIACREGVYKNAETLLDSGAWLNMTDERNENALHYALASNKVNQKIIKLLLDKGINVNAQNKHGITALHIACLEGVYESVETLLDSGVSLDLTDESNQNALHYASASNKFNPNIIQLLLKKGMDVNARKKKGTTALQIACLEGILENANLLLDSGACIHITDDDNNNAFHYASASKKVNRDIIKLLFKKGIDVNAPNKSGVTALHIACQGGIYENVEMLLECEASVNISEKRKRNALHYASASKKNNQDIVKLLIDKGIAVNDQDKHGMTALQIACREGVYGNVEMLLDFGAFVTVTDKDHRNALHYTSTSQKDSRDIIMKLLTEKGIDM